MRNTNWIFTFFLFGTMLLCSCSNDDGSSTPDPVAEEETTEEEAIEEEEEEEEEEVANNAPGPFNLIGVTDGAVGVDVYPTFSWQAATDPDDDAVSYDLYLGLAEDPTEIYAENLSDTRFEVINRLNTYDSYYWKVIAKDTENATISSETNEFTIRGLNLPTEPVSTKAAFSERYGHTSVVFDDKLWVIAGQDSGSFKNDVWALE